MNPPTVPVACIALSPGIAIGQVLPVHSPGRNAVPELRRLAPSEVEPELAKLQEAVVLTREQIKKLQSELQNKLSEPSSAIFDAHLMLVDDRTLFKGVEKHIREDHWNAEYALFIESEHYIEVLEHLQDDYLRERSADLRDVTGRIIANLTDQELHRLGADGRRIVVAHTLSPSETAGLDRRNILGFAVESGGVASHTALLARSLGIPAVAGVPAELIDRLTAGDRLIIDGFAGRLIVNPDPHCEESFRLKAQAADQLRDQLARENKLAPDTVDGFRIPLAANIESSDQIHDAVQQGAEGVGLFRTEFMYLNKISPPDEETQFEIYKRLLLEADDAPVTIRTLDIGGDKLTLTSEYRHAEDNPFLGLRGVRLCLYERRDLFDVQLRALLRAGVFGKLRVMLPMVSSVQEVLEVKAIIKELQHQLEEEKQEFVRTLSLGVMIETPAAALQAEHFADLVDFFSIGTNDLVQYTMAIDRGNEQVAYLYRPANPAVLKLIRHCVRAAERKNIYVTVCGQMAADPVLSVLLIGLGVHKLSMEPASLPGIRRVIRNISYFEAEQLAEAALQAGDAAAAKQPVIDLLHERVPEMLGEN